MHLVPSWIFVLREKPLAGEDQQPVVKVQLHSAGDASPLHPTALKNARWGPRPLTALLLPQIFPILHPTVHRTHGGGPAQRSSRRPAGVPTARTVRRGVDQRGASPPSVRRWTFTTGCKPYRPGCAASRQHCDEQV